MSGMELGDFRSFFDFSRKIREVAQATLLLSAILPCKVSFFCHPQFVNFAKSTLLQRSAFEIDFGSIFFFSHWVIGSKLSGKPG